MANNSEDNKNSLASMWFDLGDNFQDQQIEVIDMFAAPSTSCGCHAGFSQFGMIVSYLEPPNLDRKFRFVTFKSSIFQQAEYGHSLNQL